MNQGMPWVKVWIDLLDDSKVGRLPDEIKWRFVQILLVAGESDAEGYLVNGDEPLSVADVAWRLRVAPDLLQVDFERLQEAGLIDLDDGTWLVVNFARRQGRPQSEKRAAWRRRKRRQREREQDSTPDLPAAAPVTDDSPVTQPNVTRDSPVTPTDVPRDSSVNHAGVTPLEGEEERKKEKEGEREGEARTPHVPTPDSSSPQRHPAVKAYIDLTGRSPPSDHWQQQIADQVGEVPDDVARWTRVAQAWVGIGWNPGNVLGMLEYYLRGEIPGKDRNRGRGRHQSPANSGEGTAVLSPGARAVAGALATRARGRGGSVQPGLPVVRSPPDAEDR